MIEDFPQHPQPTIHAENEVFQESVHQNPWLYGEQHYDQFNEVDSGDRMDLDNDKNCYETEEAWIPPEGISQQWKPHVGGNPDAGMKNGDHSFKRR